MNQQLSLFEPLSSARSSVSAINRLNLERAVDSVSVVTVERSTAVPHGGVVGYRFGSLFATSFNGHGTWSCDCRDCGKSHKVGVHELNQGAALACQKRVIPQHKPHVVGKRAIIRDRRDRPGYMEAAKSASVAAKRLNRNVKRVDLLELNRSFWRGIQCGRLTLIEEIRESPGYWICYCDGCGNLTVKKEQLFIGGVADSCGCAGRKNAVRQQRSA